MPSEEAERHVQNTLFQFSVLQKIVKDGISSLSLFYIPYYYELDIVSICVRFIILMHKQGESDTKHTGPEEAKHSCLGTALSKQVYAPQVFVFWLLSSKSASIAIQSFEVFLYLWDQRSLS
jgi:hypothetical protein